MKFIKKISKKIILFILIKLTRLAISLIERIGPDNKEMVCQESGVGPYRKNELSSDIKSISDSKREYNFSKQELLAERHSFYYDVNERLVTVRFSDKAWNQLHELRELSESRSNQELVNTALKLYARHIGLIKDGYVISMTKKKSESAVSRTYIFE